jgi:protein-tyrosine-phosphatase
MPRILCVCTGNICRSPAVEVLLRRRLEEEGLDGWTVESAGTWAVEGRPASREIILLLAERGLDASAHTSREVNRRMVEQADLVLVMTGSHAESLRLEFPDQAHKVYLLSEMPGGRRYDIQDPYGSSPEVYRACVEELEDLVDTGFERIRVLAGKEAA